jgi:hypothetical protein
MECWSRTHPLTLALSGTLRGPSLAPGERVRRLVFG